jgi:2'-5' RNA ligase
MLAEVEVDQDASNTAPEDKDTVKTNVSSSESSPNCMEIKPRSLDSLHTTLFFGGEILCEIPARELTKWHSKISTRFAQSGFHLGNKHDIPTSAEKVPVTTTMGADESAPCTNETEKGILPTNLDPEYSFRITKINIFPMRRNNLIVADLEATPEFHELYKDVRAVAATSPCKDLQEIVPYSKNTWAPHITLANVLKPRGGGGKKRRMKFLSQMEILEQILAQFSQKEEKTLSRLTVSGIAMGGPMPPQAELNFDFRYHKPPMNNLNPT